MFELLQRRFRSTTPRTSRRTAARRQPKGRTPSSNCWKTERCSARSPSRVLRASTLPRSNSTNPAARGQLSPSRSRTPRRRHSIRTRAPLTSCQPTNVLTGVWFNIAGGPPISSFSPSTATARARWRGLTSGTPSTPAAIDNNLTAADERRQRRRRWSAPAQPSLTTQASSDITLGTTAADYRQAGHDAGHDGRDHQRYGRSRRRADNPTGSITFTLTLDGNPVPGATQTDTVSGNGLYGASYTLPTTGTVVGELTSGTPSTPVVDGNNLTAADKLATNGRRWSARPSRR